MNWKQGAWDDLDEILLEPTDEPKPEGKEQISEIDLDRIGREDMDHER